MEIKKSKLEQIGINIKNARKKSGLTQEQLAELVFVGPKTVSKWERGINAPDITLLPSIAKSLNTDVQTLLDGYETNKKTTDLLIDAVTIYVDNTKKENIKRLIGIISSLLLLFMIILITINYYKWNKYVLTINDDFCLSGYAYTNYKETKIFMNLSYCSNKYGTQDEPITDSVIVSLYRDNELLYKGTNIVDEQDSIGNIIKTMNFVYESNKGLSKKDIDKLRLIITYNNIEKEMNINVT